MNETLKRYLISALVTFVAALAGYLLLNIDSITMDTFTNGAWVGIAFLAVRTAVKAVLEMFVTPKDK